MSEQLKWTIAFLITVVALLPPRAMLVLIHFLLLFIHELLGLLSVLLPILFKLLSVLIHLVPIELWWLLKIVPAIRPLGFISKFIHLPLSLPCCLFKLSFAVKPLKLPL